MKGRYFIARKIAMLSLLTALSLITFLIENLFPPIFFIQGAKLGLSNTFSFAALIIYSPIEAFIIVAARTLLGAIFAGNLSALMYSFTAGIVSMAISSLLAYVVFPNLSIIAVSVVGAVSHNITQNAVFIGVSQTPAAVTFMPYFILIGIVSGAFIGAVVWFLIRRIPMSVFERALGVKHKNSQT